MSAEAAISLWAARRAKSPALLAFGGDSAIELAAAVVGAMLLVYVEPWRPPRAKVNYSRRTVNNE